MEHYDPTDLNDMFKSRIGPRRDVSWVLGQGDDPVFAVQVSFYQRRADLDTVRTVYVIACVGNRCVPFERDTGQWISGPHPTVESAAQLCFDTWMQSVADNHNHPIG